MHAKSTIIFVAARLVAALLFAAAPARAAEVKLMASIAAREAVLDLLPAFERTNGHRVSVTWTGTEAAARRIADGELADVVLIAAPNIDKLIAAGRLVAGSRADVAKSGIGVALRTGLPRPDISSADAVRSAVLAANSVAYSSGPSGYYMADLFRRMGISGQIAEKLRQAPSGVQVGEIVARGEADLGFQQVSELLHLKGIQYLGPLPPEIQHVTIFAAALHGAAPEPAAARALMKFLTAPEAGPIIRKSGMEPG